MCELVFSAALIALIIYVVLSWVPRPPDPIVPIRDALHRVVDPMLRPIRKVMPTLPLGGVNLDLSILVPFFALAILEPIVCGLLGG